MGSTRRKQAYWWTGAILIFMLVLWLLGQAILPFIIGAGVAYLLDPLADRLERLGLGRTASVALITVVAALAFVTFILFLAPLILNQAAQLVNAAPDMIEQLRGFLTERFPGLLPEGGTLQSSLNNLASMIGDKGGALLTSVLGSVASMVSVIALLVIVPVVAFYLLLDWDHMVARIDALLPRD